VGGLRRSFPHAQIRQHIAMMSQFPAFFHDTLRENLRIAKPDATDEELISICRTTGMLDILEAKGLTLDSNLAGGQILSGGQKKLPCAHPLPLAHAGHPVSR
jgi:ABC-type multidrug transport system fused ATPase/permease subunit